MNDNHQGPHSQLVQQVMDDAVKGSDDCYTISERFRDKIDSVRTLQEISDDVLVDHPMVSSIRFEATAVNFELTNGIAVRITETGDTLIRSSEVTT